MTSKKRQHLCGGFGCPGCGEKVGFNAKRCKACGQTVQYAGGTSEDVEQIRSTLAAAAAAAAQQQQGQDDAAHVMAATTTTLSRSLKNSLSHPLNSAGLYRHLSQLALSRSQQQRTVTRSQLTPIETLKPVEICAHVNSLRCEQLHRTLRQLVQRLMTHPLNQQWFNAPVDPVVLGLPDYFTIVEKPLDLGTIKSRLANLEYSDVESLAEDVRLVFRNAATYNPPKNAVHHAAVEMAKDFEVDLERAVDRAQRQALRVDDHDCGLCQGKQCVLCGDKCLTFETPALMCSGPCSQRVRPNQTYHVTRDGSRLWCHKCYLGLKSVIPPPAECAYASGNDDDRSQFGGGENNVLDAAAAAAESAVGSPMLWYKRDLMKRKFDEDVAEPWVQCDACARWVHQTCALFNAKAEADTGGRVCRFVCPLCELQGLAETHLGDDENDVKETTISLPPEAAAEDQLLTLPPAAQSDDDLDDLDDDSRSRGSGGVVLRAEGSDTSPCETRRALKLAALTSTSMTLEDDLSTRYVEPRTSKWPRSPAKPVVRAHKRPDGNVDVKLTDGASWHAAAVDDAKDDDDDTTTGQQQQAARPTTVPTTSPPSHQQQPQKKWWSARALRKTKMTDHLEAAVKRRMRTMGGDPQAAAMADTVCVRCLSAVPQSLRVPAVLRNNLSNPDGNPLPEVLPFESRAVALFQRNDGVDLCVFAMYVHEFGDAGSEGPSSKRVYLAYLDSVEYFRPRTARTAVYHELLTAYLDWSRKRGFTAAHIWACPPQRGNNFIFWCHPPHQRTPSRDRLGEWYRNMVKRARDVGAVSRVQTLYDEYFAHLDEQRRRRAGATPSGTHQRGGSGGRKSKGGGAVSKGSHKRSKTTTGAPVPPPAGDTSLRRVDSLSSVGSPLQRPALCHVDSLCSVDSRLDDEERSVGTPRPKTMEDRAFAQPRTPPDHLRSLLPSPLRNASPTPDDDDDSVAAPVGARLLQDDVDDAEDDGDDASSKKLPLCPPLFDGDYWPEEACRLHGLIERRRGLFGTLRNGGKPNSYATALRSAGEATVAQQFDAILKHLSQQPSAYPFMRPVDPVQLGVPDYHAVIANPMDLGTVEKKLENQEYASPQALVDDMRLVFRNAQVYNPPAHPVHEAASHLSLQLEKKLQSLFSRLKVRLNAADTRDVLLAFPLRDSESGGLDALEAFRANKAALDTKHYLAYLEKQRANNAAAAPSSSATASSATAAAPAAVSTTTTAAAEGSSAQTRAATRAVEAAAVAAAVPPPPPPPPATAAKPQTSPRATRGRRRRGSSENLAAAAAPPTQQQSTATTTTATTATTTEQPPAPPPLPPFPAQPPAPARASTIESSTSLGRIRGRDEEVQPPCPRLPIELAASVFKMKDALFVLYLQPEDATPSATSMAAKSLLGDDPLLSSGQQPPVIERAPAEAAPPLPPLPSPQQQKPGRKRRLAYPATTTRPEEETAEALASDVEFYSSPRFGDGLQIEDPDAGTLISCSLLDSRHTFLEMCQFWHYQFDSLRRAKHSSIMLLYHLHNPKADSLRILCSHCSREIRRVRWHCSTCVDYNICRECERIVRTVHAHTLTPYRITFTRRRQLNATG